MRETARRQKLRRSRKSRRPQGSGCDSETEAGYVRDVIARRRREIDTIDDTRNRDVEKEDREAEVRVRRRRPQNGGCGPEMEREDDNAGVARRRKSRDQEMQEIAKRSRNERERGDEKLRDEDEIKMRRKCRERDDEDSASETEMNTRLHGKKKYDRGRKIERKPATQLPAWPRATAAKSRNRMRAPLPNDGCRRCAREGRAPQRKLRLVSHAKSNHESPPRNGSPPKHAGREEEPATIHRPVDTGHNVPPFRPPPERRGSSNYRQQGQRYPTDVHRQQRPPLKTKAPHSQSCTREDEAPSGSSRSDFGGKDTLGGRGCITPPHNRILM